MSLIALKPSTIKLFGEVSYIHNDTNLDDFFKNQSVSMGVRIMMKLASLHSLDSNRDKAPEDRIFISNSGILRSLGFNVDDYRSQDYEDHLSAVQSVLERWEKEGVSSILGTDKQILLDEAEDDSNVLDLNAPIKRPEKVEARKNQYDSFFE